jgi:putative Holliday junction resolvase
VSSVIALDVGERRIGVAVSDPGGTFSLPHGVLERTNIRADIRSIVTIAQERGAETIVVGDPLTLGGKRGPAAEKMDAFVAQLARAFPGTIERIDERMTTAGATKTLLAAGVSRAKRKQAVDQLAAAAILDTYLARRRTG